MICPRTPAIYNERFWLESYDGVLCNNASDWGSTQTIDHFKTETKLIYNYNLLMVLAIEFYR